jgi:sulfopyruvate decarboxylase alpha subunit
LNRSEAFVALLRDTGFDFFTGVPDSTFQPLLAEFASRPELGYVTAVSENVAVGIATGAYLGGKRPVIFMQNSGLALAMNALGSLAAIYRIPILLIVGWRGHDGSDSPEHKLIGAATPALLDSLRLPYFVPDRDSLPSDVARAAQTLDAQQMPCALVCRPGVVC